MTQSFSRLRTKYDNVSVALHWLTVVIVLFQFASSLLWEGTPRPTHRALVQAHMSFGVVLTAIILFRLAWRASPANRVAPAARGLQGLLTLAVHFGLYVMLAVQAVLGFVLRWSEGRPMFFFGLTFNGPIGRTSHALHEAFGEVHEYLGWAIILVAAGHAGMAIFHQVVARDGLMRRMMPG